MFRLGWIADVLIAVLAACAVGVMLYQKVRQAHGKGGCGCSGCSGCTGCSGAGCACCGEFPQECGKEHGNG
ncbi:MAG: hypothetical protein ACLU4W_07235 [Acutalibacteraceae bacterium]